MTMRGLWVAACPDEAQRFFAFLARAAGTQLERGLHLQIMYGLGGERDLTERELGHLTGWHDSALVRVGNGAWRQQQLDVYGAVLDAAYVLRDQLQPIDPPTRKFLIAAVEAAAGRWQHEDQGVWEIRGPARRYLHSALLCWVALDRGIRLAGAIGAGDRIGRWTDVREQIRTAILTDGWNAEVGAFAQTLGGRDLDTSTAMGRMFFQILGSIAEFEQALMSERTLNGLAAARAQGRTVGQKPKLTPRQARIAQQMYEETGPDGRRLHTVAQIAAEFGVTRATIYRHLAQLPVSERSAVPG